MLNKAYWENRYKEYSTGWDVGYITPPLKAYIDQIKDKTLKILIPGCGNGYEFEYLLKKGFKNVFVLDYASAPLDNIIKRVKNCPYDHLIQSDFFTHQGQYDLILEQTFFCALDPVLRANYVEKTHSLLVPKGKLAGVLFQIPLTNQGPPYGGAKDAYEQLFSSHYAINTFDTAYNSITPRQGNELFFIFTKK